MKPARLSAKEYADGLVWIDHATLVEDDLLWLERAQRLTLWNVVVPPNFLARLPQLWWIDWRGGGAAQGIQQIGACSRLRFLCLNQIRGLKDISFVRNLTSLEMLKLYGLTQLSEVPALDSLINLKRIEVGQMKSLTSINPLIAAPFLQELQLQNFVNVSDLDICEMRKHPSLRAFEWFGENIPVKMWKPVRDALALPLVGAMYPEEWFGI